MSWFSDFRFQKRESGLGVYVKTTDQFVPLNKTVIWEFFRWVYFYSLIRIQTLPNILKKPYRTIYFEPQIPRPWYIIWTACQFGNIKTITTNPESADARFYFDDKTETKPVETEFSVPSMNYHCDDISKTYVAEVFERVFGYSLAVNPETHDGPMVAKSEVNGVHDGAVISGPTKPEKNVSYQRVVDTEENGHVFDLRTPTINGIPMCVFIKKRPIETRFSNFNTSVTLHDPADIFSKTEIEKISEFCVAMNLDWGGLDILRDKNDGRIYIVDVNKTDMSPIDPTIAEQIKAAKIMAEHLKNYLK